MPPYTDTPTANDIIECQVLVPLYQQWQTVFFYPKVCYDINTVISNHSVTHIGCCLCKNADLLYEGLKYAYNVAKSIWTQIPLPLHYLRRHSNVNPLIHRLVMEGKGGKPGGGREGREAWWKKGRKGGRGKEGKEWRPGGRREGREEREA